ncbi:MAG: TerB family tellurite resistance protein [Salaquimonas sp.]
MSSGFIDGLSRLLGGNPSAKKVADDLELTSELILLVRMMFADGNLKPAEMEMFKRLCAEIFGLSEEDIPGILEYLKDFGYETTAWDAASMFANHDPERKKALLVHLLTIAKSDNHLDISEAELIKKTAKVLGLTAEDIAASSKA